MQRLLNTYENLKKAVSLEEIDLDNCAVIEYRDDDNRLEKKVFSYYDKYFASFTVDRNLNISVKVKNDEYSNFSEIELIASEINK